MKRSFLIGVAAVIGLLGVAATSHAQVFIRAPFVRVGVGVNDGVSVRAPFVNLYVPGDPQPLYGPYYTPTGQIYYSRTPIIYGAPPPVIVAPMPPAKEFQPPVPQPVPMPPIKDDNAPPQPVQPVQAMTLEAFAKSFQPKAGSYELPLINPLTKQPTNVRFTLPEGTPKRIHTNRDSIEFVYGLCQWVRIEFDRDGAIVTSR